jgi:urease gamma subunit
MMTTGTTLRMLGCVALGLTSVACGDVASPPGPSSGAAAGMPAAGSGGSSGGSSGKNTGGSVSNGGRAGSGNPTGGSAGSSPTGGTASGGSSGTGQGGAGSAPPIGGELSDCDTPAPRLIRRLTSTQFRNTLVDAFADPNVPTADVLADPTSKLRFRVDADLAVVRDLDAGLLLNYAETVATWAVQNKLSSLAPCTDKHAGCSGPLIQNLGKRLYRETLTSDQVNAYQQRFDAEATFEDGASLVIMMMLQSPNLLYRRELGMEQGGGRFQLTPAEVASQLSYFLTDTAPDAALLDAAEQGRLQTLADIDREATRLLETPAARVSLTRYLEGWFELDTLAHKAKDDSVYALTPELRQNMLDESREFFLEAFYFGGDMAGILSAKHTHVNGALATFYQLAGPGPGAGFQKVDLTGTNRAPGLLGQAAFLTSHAQPENSSPVQRGRFVRDRILCEPIPEMPEDLDTNLDSPDGFTTNRERYAEHSENPKCVGCHTLFDPVGFAFEHFDGFGRYRDQENGQPIDATGMISDDAGTETPLDGVQSLLDYLTSGDRARACAVRYWSYYAHGRDNWQEKKCNDDQVRRDADANGYTLKSIVMGILHAPSFTGRVQDQ